MNKLRLEHSYKGSTWKKGHKYLYKKNGKYYYAKPKYGKNKNGIDYNWLEDWWGSDEEFDLSTATALKNIYKDQKDSAKFDYEYKKPLADSLPDWYSNKKELQKKVEENYRNANHAYMKAVRNYNEKKIAYENTPKGKFNKFIDKGKNFVKKFLKRKK